MKTYNGRGHEHRDEKGEWHRTEHVYIGAESKADAVRVMHEHGFVRFTLHELNCYFANCWGRPMDGVCPERGVWITRHRHYTETPRRLKPVTRKEP
jgi:hypothetical protein